MRIKKVVEGCDLEGKGVFKYSSFSLARAFQRTGVYGGKTLQIVALPS